jgi:O-antigen/teichoic acid export membrane protein
LSSLKQQSVVGVTWSLTERFGIYLTKFVIGIILARLLTPDDFGLVGMIYVFFAVAEGLVKGGFGLAYVQKKEVTGADADTIFLTNLVISLVLYALLFYTAPLIAQFYKQPVLIELTRVMGLVIVINAFNVIQQAQITRAVNFKRQAKVTLLASALSGGAGIASAWLGLGVWALVLRSMLDRALVAIGFWITSHWKPRWQFSRHSFRELFSFGSWMMLGSILQRVFDNIYILAIGKFFPAAQVGFYTKAKQFQQMSTSLAGSVGNVAFPVYSKLQGDKKRLSNAMRRFLQHSLIFLIPLIVGLIVVAEPFVILLLKEKWAPMIPYLQLLCVAGLLVPIYLINIQSFVAQGKSRLSFKLGLIFNGFRVLNILITYRFGVLYIILGEVIVSFISLLIYARYIKKSLNYGLWDQFKDIWRILLGSAVAAGVAYSLKFTSLGLPGFFILGILTFLLIYAASQYIFNRILVQDTADMIRGMIFKKIRRDR